MTVFTIGYEGLDIDSFLSLLSRNGIETLIDVRELPLSRKPGFSKTALANHVRFAGLEYVHMVDLGCPKSVRDRYRQDGDWTRYTKGFLTHLEGQGEAIAELSSLIAMCNCALMCFEADYRVCHRSMVADAVRGHCGAKVEHIAAISARTATPAIRRPALA